MAKPTLHSGFLTIFSFLGIFFYVLTCRFTFSTTTSHFFNWPLVIVYSLVNTIYVSWWAFYISFLFTTTYYFYMVFTIYYTGNYVYIALDPAINPYWWVIVFAMPVIQLGVFVIIKIIMNFRHKFVARCAETLQLNLFTIPWKFCSTKLHHFKMEMSIAVILVSLQTAIYVGLITGVFFCIGWEEMRTDYLYIFAFSIVVAVSEAICFPLNAHHVLGYKRWNVSWTWINILMFLPHLIQVAAGFSGIVVFFATRTAWAYFLQCGCSALILLTRYILLMIDFEYNGESPNDLVCEHYFN